MEGDPLKDRWLRVDLQAAPELTDALANYLEEIGADGVYQEAIAPLSDKIEEYGEEPRYECLTAHLPWEGREQRIASLEQYIDTLQGIFPDMDKTTYRTSETLAADWGEEWKKYFHPLRIGKQFVIKPTWEPYTPAQNDLVIEIDPGMAFGTGQHHSTSLCLEAMETLFGDNDGSRWRVLDLGTGTGILAIASARLGADQVIGLDIDEKAVEIARSNAILNWVGNVLAIGSGSISSQRIPFHLILANLTAKALIELKTPLESLLLPSGYLIMSGIIEMNAGDIENNFLRPPLRLIQKTQRDEWMCYTIIKD